jgi:ribulose-5-phosphate 4-epimerase/fuculose-1-phosphate aldolase
MQSRSISDVEWTTRVDLAAAYHLVQLHGWGESIYNHIAARVPDRPDMLLMKRNDITYAEVSASNLVRVDMRLDLDESTGVNRLGYVLHGGVLQARADVAASLHLHTAEIIALSCQPEGLLMLSQYAVKFFDRVGYHDYEGLTDGMDERSRILQHLGDGIAVILRHHGACTVGQSVGQAFIAAKELVEACRIQLAAQASGIQLKEIPPSICARTAQQLKEHDAGRGAADWPAYLRELDKRSPGYRS